MDDELTRLRAAGAAEAAGALFEQHARAVHAYLARRAGSVAADDLLGDVFVGALTAWGRMRPHESGSALPWLYGIAANVVRRHLRRGASTWAPVTPWHADLDHLVDTVDWDRVDARLDAASGSGELHRALAGLSPPDRELLLLVAWEGLAPADAAVALGITPEAARTRLHRARRRAQALLDSTPDEAVKRS